MSTTFLDQTSAMSELADIWETHAQARKVFTPTDPGAELLANCAAQLRRIAHEHAPQWVPIGVVLATSDIAKTTLLRRCKELEADGRARKLGHRWEVTLDVALELAKKSDRVEIKGTEDMPALARLLGRDPG